MTARADREVARRVAEEAIASGKAAGVQEAGGRLLEPVQIRSPEGGPVGWFVPIEKRPHLLGYIQVDTEGLFQRYAMFPPFTPAEGRRLAARWRRAERDPMSLLIAPTVLNVVGRK